MGFDVVYLPPIHPIGTTHRKGRGNTLAAGPDDPGSPWAIGGPEGGHDAIHPELGTIDDFDAFVDAAEDLGLEVALDYALQCCPDHPWVRDHPGVVPAPARRLDPLRREPAEEVPGHPPDRVLAGRRQATAWRCGRRAATSSSTGSATASARSASTTRTPSRSRSGSG